MMDSFTVQKLFCLTESHLFTFAFVSLAFGVRSTKTSLSLMSRSLPPVSSSRNFMVSGLTFKSLIHFEVIFVCGVRQGSGLILCMLLSSFLNTIYLRDCPFSILCPWILCHKLTVHICVHIFNANIILFDYYSCAVKSKIKEHDNANLILILKIALAFGDLLWLLTNFIIICSSPVENAIGILMGIALTFYIALGSMDIFTILILPAHGHGIYFHLFVSSSISFIRVL